MQYLYVILSHSVYYVYSKLYNNNGNIRIIIELFVLASVLFVAREVILDSIRATRSVQYLFSIMLTISNVLY